MTLRGVPRLLGGLVFRSATRDADRYGRAFSRNTRRVLFRPVRTTLSAVFMFGLLLVLYVIAYRGEELTAVMAADGGDLTLLGFLSVLPSPLLLVPGFVAVWVLTVVALISSGIDRDLGRHYR
jgi:hypothetical protein